MSTTATGRHLWQGVRIDDEGVRSRVTGLRALVDQTMAESLPTDVVLLAADRLAARLDSDDTLRARLLAGFPQGAPRQAAAAAIPEIAGFLRRSSLEEKLVRELGGVEPFVARRPRFSQPVFERWAPLGLLVHVTPGNDLAVGFLSLVEGLLSGNMNILKLSRSDTDYPLLLAEALAESDLTGRLARSICVLRIASSERTLLAAILAEAAGVAAWGGEEAIRSLREMTPAGVRFVDWGHKLSLAYVSAACLAESAVMTALAQDVCRIDQQACSSPQCIYLDTDDPAELRHWARDFAEHLRVASRSAPGQAPDDPAAAEITMVTAVQRAEAALDLGEVIESSDLSWRIYVDQRPALRASPLYRSIWVKPLPRRRIFATLWPMRQFLQTAGLACTSRDVAELSDSLVSAGVLRITEPGRMLESYQGEPHDGVYALQRYTRRISVQLPACAATVTSFAELAPPRVTLPWAGTPPPVMGKAEFQKIVPPAAQSHLFFKSGGSSGDPKFSVFSYADYHMQMELAAEGLFAAGLDPAADRCMNLFYGGGLYGGFLSFFTILEQMQVVQLPMAAHQDFAFVGSMILKYDINTVLGMPSYLLQMLSDPANAARLRAARPIKKMFYGGEHLSAAQRRFFADDFGIELIRSATYGSVDAGPLGYQCLQCDGGVHHLHHRLQHLEILATDADMPAPHGEVGRLVFTSLHRHGQAIHRYDIGDLGRWVEGQCACGRQAPRFELLGRHGDVFRAGGSFFNYQKICNLIGDQHGYGGEIQLVIERVAAEGDLIERDRLTVVLGQDMRGKEAAVRAGLIAGYPEVAELVVTEEVLRLEVRCAAEGGFDRAAGSGKLRHIVDRRGQEAGHGNS